MTQSALEPNSSVAIIATATDGAIRAFNRAAENMFGYRADEVIGQRTPLHFHEEAVIAPARLGSSEVREWTYVRKDGTQVPVELVVTAIPDSQGAVSGYLFIAKDLAEGNKPVYKERLELVARGVNDGIREWDIATDQCYFSDRSSELAGLPTGRTGRCVSGVGDPPPSR